MAPSCPTSSAGSGKITRSEVNATKSAISGSEKISKNSSRSTIPFADPPPRANGCSPQDFADYVEHPRFGRSPRFTGVAKAPNAAYVYLFQAGRLLTERETQRLALFTRRIWIAGNHLHLVPGTAIVANPLRQKKATIPATHYFDLDKVCRSCRKRFLFFAEEQKHWHEELGFPLDADAVNCPVCRKRLQQISRIRNRYEEMFHLQHRSFEQNLELATCRMTLIEQGIFPRRHATEVKRFLNLVSAEDRQTPKYRALQTRLQQLDAA